MNTDRISFQQAQQQFCTWIREPQNQVPQTLSFERMQVYRDLLLNNVCSFIDLVYPVARSMLPEQQWQTLLEEFFQKSKCQSPFYNDISLQFREYLTDHQHPILHQYPWLAELLQFEWLELYLDTLEIEDKIYTQTDLWQLRTHVWVLVYQYPVYHWTINTTLAQIEHVPSAIMVWRNEDDQVCVEQLSPLLALLIERLNQKAMLELELNNLIQSAVANLSAVEIQTQIKNLSNFLIKLKLLYIPK